MGRVSIINCGSGNFQSVVNAFEFMKIEIEQVTDPAQLIAATHVVLPGVGAFGALMEKLSSLGFIDALQNEVFAKDKFYLGICVGMQIMASQGTEFSRNDGLNIVPGSCDRIDVAASGLPIPHVGWNLVDYNPDCALFAGVARPAYFYYVHSFQVNVEDLRQVVARSEYGTQITAAIQRGNAYGVQFHPEKSQGAGLSVLRNFSQLSPC